MPLGLFVHDKINFTNAGTNKTSTGPWSHSWQINGHLEFALIL